MSQKPSEASALLERSLKLRVYVVFGRRSDEVRLQEKLAEHVRWVMDLERQGRVFLCGPLTPVADAAAPASMLVLRAESLDEAYELARQDPLVRHGVVTFELREWTIYEGAIPLFVSMSDGGARFF